MIFKLIEKNESSQKLLANKKRKNVPIKENLIQDGNMLMAFNEIAFEYAMRQPL